MSTVFILGAGASRNAGGPLMADFIECASEVSDDGEEGWAKDYFKNAFDARQKLRHALINSKVEFDNIESLFATYEMAALIGRLSNLAPDTIDSLSKSLRFTIMRTLERKLLFPIDKTEKIIQSPYPYDAFAELIKGINAASPTAPVSVINFNYDLCLDYALTISGNQIDYGLGAVAEKNKRTMRHYKLHGSLNWFRDNSGNIISKPIIPRESSRYWDIIGLNEPGLRPIDTVELLSEDAQWGEGPQPEPIIVPPSWNKGWYHEQLKSVWRSASKALSEARRVYIIGYSLPPSDQFFRSFFSLSTITDHFINAVRIFDPSADKDLIERFSSLMGPAITNRGRFQHSKLDFVGAVKALASEHSIAIPRSKIEPLESRY